MTSLSKIYDTTTPIVGDLLRIGLFAGINHPKKTTRKGIFKCLDKWLDGLGAPPFDHSQLAQIASRDGSQLEPFVLETRDLDVVARVARMAFHFGCMETGSEPNILIGSRDAIGGGGGVLLDRNDKGRFIRRFPYEHHTEVSENVWSYGPQFEQHCLSSELKLQIHSAQWRADKRQNSLIVTSKACQKLGWASFVMRKKETRRGIQSEQRNLDDDIKRNSSLGHRGEGFGRFGLDTSLDSDGLSIKPSSPEALLRFSALMAQGAIVTLDPDTGPSGSRKALHILLDDPNDKKTNFLAVSHSRSGNLANWLRFPPLSTAPEFNSSLRKDVFDWWLSRSTH